MSNFTDNEKSCRVDIFKESGKWYTTIAVEFENWLAQNKDGSYNIIHDEFKKALYKVIGNSYKSMWAVCLEPYHELSHPLMMKIE